MLGKDDGSTEGVDVGARDGRIDIEGALEEKEENVGRFVGDAEGSDVLVGTFDGTIVGTLLGLFDGSLVGLLDGLKDGFTKGAFVGTREG